jgi:hypothetical protein
MRLCLISTFLCLSSQKLPARLRGLFKLHSLHLHAFKYQYPRITFPCPESIVSFIYFIPSLQSLYPFVRIIRMFALGELAYSYVEIISPLGGCAAYSYGAIISPLWGCAAYSYGAIISRFELTWRILYHDSSSLPHGGEVTMLCQAYHMEYPMVPNFCFYWLLCSTTRVVNSPHLHHVYPYEVIIWNFLKNLVIISSSRKTSRYQIKCEPISAL